MVSYPILWRWFPLVNFMKKAKTLLAAAILGLIAFAGNSQAQTPAPTPTPPPWDALRASVAPLIVAHEWDRVIATGSAAISGTWLAVVNTDAANLNNAGITIVHNAINAMSGRVAGRTFALSMGAYSMAADDSFVMRRFADAISDLQRANSGDPFFQALLFKYQAAAGQNVNTAIVAFLNAQPGIIQIKVADICYQSFKYAGTPQADVLSFYNLLLQSVESNQANAAWIGKILDQKNKLTK